MKSRRYSITLDGLGLAKPAKTRHSANRSRHWWARRCPGLVEVRRDRGADPMSRRARHVAGLTMWASDRPSYRLKLGKLVVPFDVLTDDALADLRTRLARDLRRERRRIEANRPFYVADAIRAGHRLPPETMAFAAAILGAEITIAA